MKSKFILYPVAILAAGVLIMFILFGFAEEPEQTKFAPKVKSVNARIIEMQEVQSEIVAFGRLKSTQPVVLISEVNGRLEAGDIPFLPAQSFRKGELLVRVDDRQIKFDLNSTKSDFLTALASVLPEIKMDFPEEYQIWQDYFDACGFDKNLDPLPGITNQKVKLFLSRFNVYKLYFSARNLEIQLAKHYFYAPFKGSILSTDLRAGSTARNGSRLGEIINLANMEVEVPISASDISWIDEKQPVTLTSAETGGTWLGRIKRTGRAIDTQTQTVQLFIDVTSSNGDDLYDGIFLKVVIPGKSIPNAAALSRRVIYRDKYVYLVKNGKLQLQEISIGRTEMDSVIITGGIQKGDTLVTDVLQGVADGMLARAKL